MATRKIDPAEGAAAVVAALVGLAGATEAAEATVSRSVLATAVRYLLQEIAAAHPGHSVELRVPPFGAVQIVEGPRHTRGTPPAIVEMDAATWVRLATARSLWADELATGRIHATGVRSDLSGILPVYRPR